MKTSKILAVLLMTILPVSVFAAGNCTSTSGLGFIACNLTDSFAAVVQAVGAWAYLAAFIFGVAAAYKLKEWNEDSRQTKLSTPGVLIVVAMLLAYLPTSIETTGDTFWGQEKRTSQGVRGENVGF